MKKSDIVFLFETGCASDTGVGGLVLATDEIKFPELPERRNICGIGREAEGGSMGAMETRPAMRDTRCCEDRRRGRG